MSRVLNEENLKEILENVWGRKGIVKRAPTCLETHTAATRFNDGLSRVRRRKLATKNEHASATRAENSNSLWVGPTACMNRTQTQYAQTFQMLIFHKI